MKKLNEFKIYLNDNIEIKDDFIAQLIQRETKFNSHFKLIIDEKQSIRLKHFEKHFTSGLIGVIDFDNKTIPEGHYKQIDNDVINKYKLVDPFREKLRQKMINNSEKTELKINIFTKIKNSIQKLFYI